MAVFFLKLFFPLINITHGFISTVISLYSTIKNYQQNSNIKPILIVNLH